MITNINTVVQKFFHFTLKHLIQTEETDKRLQFHFFGGKETVMFDFHYLREIFIDDICPHNLWQTFAKWW